MSEYRTHGAGETDQELMRRVARGDGQAFEVLHDRYANQAHAFARHVMGRTNGAEDATQDAFISLWRTASSYDPARARLSAWLFSLVRNRCIDLLRQSKSRTRYESLGLDGSKVDRIEAPERTDEKVLTAHQYHEALRLVAKLPPDQGEVIGLSYLGGYTQSEIAMRVGIPAGTVKSRARLGLEKLRKAAERESATASAA